MCKAVIIWWFTAALKLCWQWSSIDLRFYAIYTFSNEINEDLHDGVGISLRTPVGMVGGLNLGQSIPKPYVDWKVLVLRWHWRRVCEDAESRKYLLALYKNSCKIRDNSLDYNLTFSSKFPFSSHIKEKTACIFPFKVSLYYNFFSFIHKNV